MNSDAGAISLWHIGIPVTNLDRSVAFYCRVLGFTLVGFDEYADKKQAFVSIGQSSAQLELFEAKSEVKDPARPDHLAFEVPNLRAFHESLRSKLGYGDVPDVDEFENGILHLKLADPDGLCLQFFQGRQIYDEFLLSRRGAPQVEA